MLEFVQIYSRATFKYREEIMFDHELSNRAIMTFMGLKAHFSDVINIAELFGLTSMMYYCATTVNQDHWSNTKNYLHLVSCILILHRGATSFLTLFDTTRYMIKMILVSIGAMVPFGTVVIALLLAISVCYF